MKNRSHTRITLVGIHLQIALGQVEVGLGDDLVQRELAPAHQLAGAAVAEDVSFLGDLGGPFGGAAVALALVLRHCKDLLFELWLLRGYREMV